MYKNVKKCKKMKVKKLSENFAFLSFLKNFLWYNVSH